MIKFLDKEYRIDQLYVCSDSKYVFLPTIFISHKSFAKYCSDNDFEANIEVLQPLYSYLRRYDIDVNDLEFYLDTSRDDD